MYLSRLILNPRSRQVQRELADPYQMHRTILSAFPETLPVDERVLFRVDQHPRTAQITLLVQSLHPPDWSSLARPGKAYLHSSEHSLDGLPNPDVKLVQLALRLGQTLAFRLRANPTIKRNREGKKQGRRVGLYREEDQLQWLERKLESAGAKLISARISDETRLNGKLHRDGKRHDMTFLSVQFDGFLRVEIPDNLVEAVENGIGSGKGLGFGLLSLAPVR